jgi:hypothetical protein
MNKKLYELLNIKIKGVEEETFTLEAIFSTEDEDRHGDIVRQNWDLKQFKKNPVILNSHNYWSATDVIGKAEKIGVKNGQLEGKIKFAVEENPIAKIIFDLYKGGFLNAFSVGFIPKEFSDKGEILKSELLEISAVSVPANAMALAKSAGIDLKPLFKGINEALEEEIEEDGGIDVEQEKDLPEVEILPKPEEEAEEETPEAIEQAKIDAENDIKEEEEKEKEKDEVEEVLGCPIGEDCDKEKQIKEKIDTMLKLVKDTGEILKAETLQEGVRAGVNRLLNKAIREQVKIIKNNK